MPKLSDAEASRLLAKHGLSVPKHKVVKTEKQALDFARKVGYPVVLKVSSKQVVHKIDVGGVAFADNMEELKKGFRQVYGSVKKVKGAKLDGVLVQKKVEGIEVIIGGKQDSQFGPVIMFGLGGIFVEALKDVVFRLVPITRQDAEQMLVEIKGRAVLEGLRGKRIDREALVDALLKASRLMEREGLAEMDLNPVMAGPKQAWVADARFVK